MKEITIYESPDKVTFQTKKECEDYEKILKKVGHIYERLNAFKVSHTKDKELGMVGERYMKNRLLSIKGDLLNLTKKFVEGIEDIENSDIVQFGILRRHLDDCNYKCLKSIWNHLQCVDHNGIIYDQPYFAFKSVQEFDLD